MSSTTEILHGAYVNSFRSLMGIMTKALEMAEETGSSKGLGLWSKFLSQAPKETVGHWSSFFRKNRETLLDGDICTMLQEKDLVLSFDEALNNDELPKKAIAAIKLYISDAYRQLAYAERLASTSSEKVLPSKQLLMYLYRVLYLSAPLLDSEAIKVHMCTLENDCKEPSILNSLVQNSPKPAQSNNPLANLDIGALLGHGAQLLQQVMHGGKKSEEGKEIIEKIAEGIDPEKRDGMTETLEKMGGVNFQEVANNVIAAVGSFAKNFSENNQNAAETVPHAE